MLNLLREPVELLITAHSVYCNIPILIQYSSKNGSWSFFFLSFIWGSLDDWPDWDQQRLQLWEWRSLKQLGCWTNRSCFFAQLVIFKPADVALPPRTYSSDKYKSTPKCHVFLSGARQVRLGGFGENRNLFSSAGSTEVKSNGDN